MALMTIERVAALRRTSLFAAVPDHVLAGLARIAGEVAMDTGDAIIVEGDEDDSLLVIVDGQIRVHVGDRTLADLGPGTTVGELAILSPEPRSASVTATTAGVLLRITKAAFDELLIDHPELARSIITMLVGIIRERTRDSVIGHRA